MESVISTAMLTKLFRNKPAVYQVNLNLRRGQIYGFVGRNGAGKTTLIRMVAGLAAPSEGQFTLFESEDLGAGRKRMGTVIENPSVYPNLTAIENLTAYALLLGIRDESVSRGLLEQVGLADTGKKKAKNFSLGMKQRLAIAISLLGNPDLLILDEPMNGLDPEGIHQLRELLLRLNREKGVTILVSSHILSELSKIATCYGVINNGVLVRELSVAEMEEKTKSTLRVKVDNSLRAGEVLKNILQINGFDYLPDNCLNVYEGIDDPARINKTLVQNDVVVYSLTSESTADDDEAFFLRLMGGEARD